MSPRSPDLNGALAGESPRRLPGQGDVDVVENTLHHAVCDHQVSLHAAQLAIGTDWYTALHRLHLTAIPGR